jgi:rRNA pseudouridine-1189 N-methylase Emg1 (Nep1/Mra1 family)
MSTVTLDGLKKQVTGIMETSETNLATALGTISSGDTVSNVELLKYQMEMASNSLTATIASSIVKERAETLKGVAQKF